MLRPKTVNENIDNFNDVTKDALARMTAVRGSHGKEGEIPDLEGEMFKWSTECEYFIIIIIIIIIIIFYFIVITVLLYWLIDLCFIYLFIYF